MFVVEVTVVVRVGVRVRSRGRGRRVEEITSTSTTGATGATGATGTTLLLQRDVATGRRAAGIRQAEAGRQADMYA